MRDRVSLLLCVILCLLLPAGEKKPLTREDNPVPEFVSSSKSPAFHLPECRFVIKILDHHLQKFDTREEAVKAGKRACKVCKP